MELFASQFEEDPELLDKIRHIGLRLEDPISSDDIPVIGLKIKETMLVLQRRIFMNRGMWFRVESSPKRFGTLFVLEDDFVSENSYPDNLGYK